MKRKATKELKQRLIEQQRRKLGEPYIPITVAVELTSITRIKGDDNNQKKALETKSAFKGIFNDYDYDALRTIPFRPEPSMPGFNSF